MSCSLYKFFNGTQWKRHAALTITIVPVFVISMLAAMTLTERMELNRFGEPNNAEFDKVYLYWAFFNIPNVAIGCWLGYKIDKFEVPVKTTRLGRSVPTLSETPCYAHGWFTISLGSILICSSIIFEAYYLVTSLWHHYYFIYIYLTICIFVMAYVASAVSVVQTYVMLLVGNYNWWWRSFGLGFAVGVHIFVACSYFLFFVETDASFSLKLNIGAWTAMLCMLTGLVAGTCSFIGSWYFVKRIYT